MARHRMRLLSALVALVASALGAEARREVQPASPSLVVIVNPRNPEVDLSMNELRAYFRLERSWPGNLPAKLWLRSSEMEDGILLDRVYKWDEKERRRYFRDRENRGEIKAPSFTPTAAGAGRKVAEEEGAFSVVMSYEIPEGVKALLIDGKDYEDPEYPLRSVAE